jgi:hypothetical protein
VRKLLVAFIALSFALPVALLGVSGQQVRYAGGTLSNIPENATGFLKFVDEAALFSTKDGRAQVRIPYAAIESLEYGQKAGRRVGAAIVVHPLFLFSKKRKHFLTVGFTDEQSKHQGAVFELSKGIVNQTLRVLEARTGKKIEYESEEARKFAEKN